MNRGSFAALLGGAGGAFFRPVSALAQIPMKAQRVALLLPYATTDKAAQAQVAAFRQALAAQGWIEGQSVRFEPRWTGNDPNLLRRAAHELANSSPAVVLAATIPALETIHSVTTSVPIIFVAVPDAGGLVSSLARPSGNVTGFTNGGYGIISKLLQLLREAAPQTRRLLALWSPGVTPEGWPRTAESIARRAGVALSIVAVHRDEEISSSIEGFAKRPHGALLAFSDNFTRAHRAAIIASANRYRLPSIYGFPYYAADGGLMSYGPDLTDNFRRAAGYADRILRGARPAELPVQNQIKFDFVINMKTAGTIGLTVPQSLLLQADTVLH